MAIHKKSGFVGATESNPLGIEGARQNMAKDLADKDGVDVGLGYDENGDEVLVVTVDDAGAKVPKEFEGFAVRKEVRSEK